MPPGSSSLTSPTAEPRSPPFRAPTARRSTPRSRATGASSPSYRAATFRSATSAPAARSTSHGGAVRAAEFNSRFMLAASHGPALGSAVGLLGALGLAAPVGAARGLDRFCIHG